MARDWQMRASIALLVTLVFVVASVATLSAWWTWGPLSRPFEYINVQDDRAVVANGYVTIHRRLLVHRTVELHTTRELVQRDGIRVSRVQLPESRATYRPGEYQIARPLALPGGIPPGEYQMTNVVHWRVNPIRVGDLPLPPVTVVIE